MTLHIQSCILGRRAAGVLILALLVGAAGAQEPIQAFDSATQPSPGHVILKEQFRFTSLELEHGPPRQRGTIYDAALMTTVNIGILADLALSVRAPVTFRRRSFDQPEHVSHDAGVGDVTLLAKWRLLRRDFGPLDSLRFSILGGPELRSGDGPFTSNSYDFILGCAYTQIHGRHGLNAALHWKFTTGRDNPAQVYAEDGAADALRYDLAYLFRLAPREFAVDSTAAWYGVLELNGVYETNGDHELLIGPGLMYEARLWTWELSVQAPVWREIDSRARTRYVIVTGLRFSF